MAKRALIGAIMQQPPMYSAVSIKGERLYKAARRGQHSLGNNTPTLIRLSITPTCPRMLLSNILGGQIQWPCSGQSPWTTVTFIQNSIT